MTTIQTPRGILLLALFLAGVAALLLLTGCTPAPSELCQQVAAGSLLQTGDNPVTFTVLVDRQVVAEGVTLDAVMQCGVGK